MDFIDWMRAEGLSEKSANSYMGAIKGRLTDWAQANRLTSKPIVEIPDMEEFVALVKDLIRTPEFQQWNATGHGMYGAALNNYKKYLSALTQRKSESKEFGPCHQQMETLELEAGEPFDPKGQGDARARVLREVVQRRGQQKFRKSLMEAYGGRCAITGCTVLQLLEAAHITPYLGPDTNSISNGLLLRADLHTLWDLGLVAVDPKTRTVWVNPNIIDPTYQCLSGKPLVTPLHLMQWPSVAALEQQWELAHEKLTALGG